MHVVLQYMYMWRCQLVDKPSQLDAQASNEVPKREGGALGGGKWCRGLSVDGGAPPWL